MKKIYKLLPILMLPVILVLFAHSAGSPGGKSGSPGDSNKTCTECHTGTATAVNGWISTNIPSEGYTPGQTYTITASGTHAGVVKFGFELTAETGTGVKTGTIVITDAARTQLTNVNKAVTHTSAGNIPNGNSNTWSVNWTAPASNVGQVRFYAAFNAANGNGNNQGDVIYKSNLFVNYAEPAVLVSVSPDHSDQGQTVDVTITGQNTHWTIPAPVVKLRNTINNAEQFNASNVQVISQSELLATFNIPIGASLGMYDLLVSELVLPSSFLVTIVNSIEDSKNISLNIYPNPTTDKISVDVQSPAIFSLYDLTGKLILDRQLETGKNELDLSGFQPGMYITVIEVNKKVITDKLIIR